jgi:DNA-binding MarR family transcriptional regulator
MERRVKPKKPSVDDLKPIQCVCTNLKMASRVVGRSYDLAVEPAGVNVIQYAILINVSRYQPISQMRLADHLEMERTTLYRALAVLEKRRLLVCEPTGDGVAKNVRLTPRGEQITAAAQERWAVLHDGVVQKFGAKKLAELNDLLAAVREHFKG